MFIEIKNLSKYYGDGDGRYKVLDSVNASIQKGNICVIVGPSGSGKSTMLNCIGGLETIDEGSITIDGVDIAKLKTNELSKYRRSSLGFVFQFYNLIPNLTVSDNIDVCRFLTKNPLDKEELLKLLGIYEKRNCLPKTLSGGEQQRCAIARALVKNPSILLCDEPTGALDSATAKEILCVIEKLNVEYKTTVLMVTHNPAILPMAHQVITVRDGRITDAYTNTVRTEAQKINI